jgi:hypothetical protein
VCLLGSGRKAQESPTRKHRCNQSMTSVKPIPEGYHTVTPYILVQGADKLIDFIKKAFNAKETERYSMPDGSIGHAEIRIGDECRVSPSDSHIAFVYLFVIVVLLKIA